MPRPFDLRTPSFPGGSRALLLGSLVLLGLLVATSGAPLGVGIDKSPGAVGVELRTDQLGSGTWSGSGSLSMTSTPGVCSGTGSGSISLNSSGGSVTGRLTSDLTQVYGGCVGDFATGPLSTEVTGTVDGNDLTLVDSEGDSLSGSLSGSVLTLTMTLAPGSSGGGGTCAAFCDSVFRYSLSGSGDLFSGGFLSLSPDQIVLSTFAMALGAVGLGLGASGNLPRASGSGGRKAGGTAEPPFGRPPTPSGPMPYYGGVPGGGYPSDHWTATPANPPPSPPDPGPAILSAGGGTPLSGVGAGWGLPDCWPGHPPPKSLDEPCKDLCPIHHLPLHVTVVRGTYETGLRWECPGPPPHLAFCGSGG